MYLRVSTHQDSGESLLHCSTVTVLNYINQQEPTTIQFRINEKLKVAEKMKWLIRNTL